MDKYLFAIREKICSICPDSDDSGKCTLNKDEYCAVELYLHKIVSVINDNPRENISDYYELLRQNICNECRTSNDDGTCNLRDDVNCSLDRLFPRIVEVIKSVN